jgi:hypothetical protein
MPPQRADVGLSERVLGLCIRLAEPFPVRFACYEGIAVGIQRGQEILPSVLGRDGRPAVFAEVRVRMDTKTGAPNFLGPYVHGTPRDRFLYLSWTHADGDARAMFRRMKVPLGGITTATLEALVLSPGTVLTATVPTFARDGGPACATVPFVQEWTLPAAEHGAPA